MEYSACKLYFHERKNKGSGYGSDPISSSSFSPQRVGHNLVLCFVFSIGSADWVVSRADEEFAFRLAEYAGQYLY